MNFLFYLLLSAAFYAAATGSNVREYDDISTAPKPTGKPATTPRVTPTKAPKVEVPCSNSDTAKLNMVKDARMETLPIKMPATVDHPLEAVESKPLVVTGFITLNDSIYEIEDKNGIGKIQSRQALNDGQYICNYGAIVIYSDVPCEEVINVKVNEKAENLSSGDAVSSDNNNLEDAEHLEMWQKPASSHVSKPKAQQATNNKKRPYKNGQKQPKRPNKTNLTRPSKAGQKSPNKTPLTRPNKNGQHRPDIFDLIRPSKAGQKRPNKNPIIRPKPQKKPNKNGGPKRPIKGGQKKPNKRPTKRPLNTNNRNLRQWEDDEEDDDDDDYEAYFKNQRYQKYQPYTSAYDDYYD